MGRPRAPRLVLATTLAMLSIATVGVMPAGSAEAPPSYITEWGWFDEPGAIGIDAAGNVYVVGQDDLVRKFTPDGDAITTWEISYGSRGVAIDCEGNVYVTDRYSDLVRKFTPGGAVIAVWETDEEGDTILEGPTGIEIDPVTCEVLVVDHGNNRIVRFSPDGDVLAAWSGGIRYPEDLAIDPSTGDVFVVEGTWDPPRVWRFTADGAYVNDWGSSGYANGQFVQPMGVAVDGSGNVYVADAGNRRIQKFNGDGTFVSEWGSAGYGPGEFDWPSAVAVDASGDVYVADTMNGRIQKFGYRGRPDGRIARGTGSLAGNDIYNGTGKSQTKTGSASAGRKVTYSMSVQNDAIFAEQLRLKGQGSTSRFGVAYKDPEGRDITDQVTAGTYRTPNLAPGETHEIKMIVTVKRGAPVGSSAKRTLTAFSTTHPTMKDTIASVTKRK